MTASVTVVIPCFRCAKTVGRALQSVAEQTIRPYEVILIDDDSRDDTIYVLRQKSIEFGREWIKVIHVDNNSGPAAIRNMGWNIATSEYIAFLDADDAWHPKKIEIQHDWMTRHPETVLTGHLCLVIKNGMSRPALPEQWTAQWINPKSLLRSNRFVTSTVMLHRDLPFRFQESQRHCEDYLLWMQIVMAGKAGYSLNLPLAFSFKARYGAGGLSADLWAMEKGELSNYRRLNDDGVIPARGYLFLIFLSIAKYLVRCVRTMIRRLGVSR